MSIIFDDDPKFDDAQENPDNLPAIPTEEELLDRVGISDWEHADQTSTVKDLATRQDALPVELDPTVPFFKGMVRFFSALLLLMAGHAPVVPCLMFGAAGLIAFAATLGRWEGEPYLKAPDFGSIFSKAAWQTSGWLGLLLALGTTSTLATATFGVGGAAALLYGILKQHPTKKEQRTKRLVKAQEKLDQLPS